MEYKLLKKSILKTLFQNIYYYNTDTFLIITLLFIHDHV